MSTESTLTRELAALDDALAGRPVEPDLADLGELAIALRAYRPEPAEAFARSLDVRVQRGFPRAVRRGPRRPRLRGLALPGLAVTALVAAAVAVFVLPMVRGNVEPLSPEAKTPIALPTRATDGSGTGAGTGSSTGPRASAPSGSASTPVVPGPLPAPVSRAPSRGARRSVERSAQLTLAARPDAIDSAAAAILRVTDDVGGYVVSSTVTSGSGGEFELRVPEARLQDALSRLSRAAKVRERTQSSQDITATAVSARARLTDARTERRSLLRQLARAATPNATSSIRRRLRLVSGQIAAAKRDLQRVQARASTARVAVSLVAERSVGAGGGGGGSWTPADALHDAARVLEVTAGVLLIALSIALPAALLALLAWVATRRASQRRRERALDAV